MYRLRSPMTLEPIGELTCATAADVQAAMARARAAQPAWGARSVADRAEYVHRLADLLIAQRDRIIETVIRETGKPRAEALIMEVYSTLDACVFYAQRAAKFLKPERRRLHGVVGLLKKRRSSTNPSAWSVSSRPWNGPVRPRR